MNKTLLASAGIATWALLVLLGCSSSTQLTTVWSDPAVQPRALQKLMVINVAKNATVRRAFEDRFASALKSRGIDAVPSYQLVGDVGLDLDSTHTSMEMHKNHCDGVFVTRVVDEKTVKTYYPPTTRTVPRSYYGGWYSYYSRGYEYVTTPGYAVQNQIVNMETNLYRVSDGALVWSALSRTWLQESDTPGDETNQVVRQLVRGLSNTKIISQQTKQ